MIKLNRLRGGFSMIVAIFTILVISIVASYIFYSSASISKEGETQYKREQAMLLARSYTEYAVLGIMGNGDRNITAANGGRCLNIISGTIGQPNSGLGYNIVVSIKYIGKQQYLRACNANSDIVSTNVTDDTLNAIIDVYVAYKDWSGANVANAPWITYHRRSIQKL